MRFVDSHQDAWLRAHVRRLARGNPMRTQILMVQGIVLVFFVVLTIGAWRRFRPMAFA